MCKSNKMNPIKSYGIVLFRESRRSGGLEYLLVQRKTTMAYSEFIQGHYMNRGRDYIIKLLEGMTEDEQRTVLDSPFEALCQTYWMHSYRRSDADCKRAKKAYVSLLDHGGIVELLGCAAACLPEREFGFCKGRRNNSSESEVDCALRELSEESGIDVAHVEVLDGKWAQETFDGGNGVNYYHKYFLARLRDGVDVPGRKIPAPGSHAYREIASIEWFAADAVADKFCGWETRRKAFEHMHQCAQAHARPKRF